MSATILWAGLQLVIDVTVSETHTFDSVSTENPTEDVDVTDHIRPEADQLSLQGVVSNTPISTDGTEYPFGAPGRGEQALEMLLRIRKARELVTVITTRRRYENMVMRSLVVTMQPGKGEGLHFSAQFRAITVVRTQTVDLPKATKPRGKGPVNSGKQVGKNAPKPKRISILKGDIVNPLATRFSVFGLAKDLSE